MADPLGTAVRMPSSEKLSTSIVAFGEYTAAGAGAAVVCTLDSDYPPIDITLQSPILFILQYPKETGVRAVTEMDIFIPNDQMDRGVDPDGVNEFRVTTNRTFTIWDTSNKNGIFMISYIPQGSPQLT